jgi:hypothetical protein
MDSQFWIGHMVLAQVYAETGETDLAFEEMRDAAGFSGGKSKAVSVTGYLLAEIGKTSEAREVLRKLEADSHGRYVPPYAMALVHAGLGERDDVFRVARQSLRRPRRSPHLSDSRSEVGRLSGRRPFWRTPRALRLRSEVIERFPFRCSADLQVRRVGQA